MWLDPPAERVQLATLDQPATLDPRDPRDPRETLGPPDFKDPPATLDPRDPRDPLDPLDPLENKCKVQLDPMDQWDQQPHQGPRAQLDPMDPRAHQGGQGLRDPRAHQAPLDQALRVTPGCKGSLDQLAHRVEVLDPPARQETRADLDFKGTQATPVPPAALDWAQPARLVSEPLITRFARLMLQFNLISKIAEAQIHLLTHMSSACLE